MEYTTLLLYLLSSTWTHSCNFPHTSGRITVCQRLEKLGLWSTSQFGSGGVKSAPGDQSCLSVDCFLRLSLLLSSLYIKHYDLILPFICSYMWDLISRAHIWCAFGFVLETGCYTSARIWHYYCLFAPIPFSRSNLFFFIFIVSSTEYGS